MTGPAPLDRSAERHGSSGTGLAGTGPSGTAAGRFWPLPRQRHWLLLAVLLSAVVIALGVTVKLLPGDTAAELGIDQNLSQHHIAVLTAVAMAINLVFGPVVGLAVVAVIALVIWLVRGDLVKAVAFGLTACSGWVASEAFKLLIARQRPDQGLLVDPLSPETGSNSFPSGHVSFAVALAFALFFLVRGTRWARPVAVLGAVVAVIVAWSRLYVGVHYPTDVTASFLAASAAVLVVTGLWNRFGPALAERIPAALRSPRR